MAIIMDTPPVSSLSDAEVWDAHRVLTPPPESLSKESEFSPLGDLSPELLEMVLEHLDSAPPSQLKQHHRPHPSITRGGTAVPDMPLKNLSVAATWTRRVALRHLFKHACLDPNGSPEFLDFILENGLAKYVHSITAVMSISCKLMLHPLWWARLLNTVPAQTFTIVCPPVVFAEFMCPSVVDQVRTDSVAYDMPFHSMTFHQSHISAIQHTDLNRDHDIFSARKWTDLCINEGSFLRAYSRTDPQQPQQYFLRPTPSLISQYLVASPPQTEQALAQLKSFTYTAVFPFFNHIDKVLKIIRKMIGMTHLTIRLCPLRGSEAADPSELPISSSGAIDMADPWNEVRTCYTLLAHTVRAMCADGSLQTVYMPDIEAKTVPEDLVNVIAFIIGGHKMTHQGSGVWQRVKACEPGQQEVIP